jgi:MFS family permease
MSIADVAEPRGRQTSPLRHNRDFRLLWTGAGLSFLGSQVSAFAYPLLVLWQFGSPVAAGIVLFAAKLPTLLFQLPAGIIVDRWDRRRLMIACDVGRTIAVGGLVLALFTGWMSIPLLVGVAFVEESLAVLYRLAERAAIRHVVTEEQLPAAVSQNEARERASGLLGSPGAGLFMALTRWAPFLFTVLTSVGSLITLLLLRNKKLQAARSDAPSRIRTEFVEGITWVWRQKFIRTAVLLVAVSNILFEALTLTVMVIVRDDGGSQLTIGLVVAVAGIGGMAGALSGSWWMRRASLPAIVIGANVAWAALMPFVAVLHDPFALGGLFAVMGYFGAVWTVAIATYQLGITPDAIQGKVLSVIMLIAFGAVPFGSLVGGFLLQELGTATVVLILSALTVVLAVAALLSPSVRRAAHVQPLTDD